MARIIDAIRQKHPKQTGRELSWLSASLEVKVQVVQNWTTRGLPPERYAAVADVLGWSIDAVAGRTPPPPPTEWPFQLVDRERFDRLSDVQKGLLEGAMLDALDRLEALEASPRLLEGPSRKRQAGGH